MKSGAQAGSWRPGTWSDQQVRAQALRLRRAGYACLASLAVVVLFLVLAWEGMVDLADAAGVTILISFEAALVVSVIATGWNLRVREPSLTVPQCAAGMLALGICAGLADAHGRSVILACIPTVFIFSSLRYGMHSLRAVAIVGGVTAVVGLVAGAWIKGVPFDATGLASTVLAVLSALVVVTTVNGRINDARKQSRAQLATARGLLNGMTEAVLSIDMSGIVHYANGGARRILGLQDANPEGRHIDEVIRLISGQPLSRMLAGAGTEEDSSRSDTGASTLTMAGTTTPPGVTGTEGVITRHQLRIGLEDSRMLEVELRVMPLMDAHFIPRAGDATHALMLSDISDSRKLIRELRSAVGKDPVTGLQNRRGFLDCMNAMNRTVREHGREPCALVIDLDQFKIVNETCGHEAGDDLLREVAHTIESLAPAGSCVARFGGDEFGLAVVDMTLEEVNALAEELIAMIANIRLRRGDRVLRVAASVGIAQGASRAEGTMLDLVLNNDEAHGAGRTDEEPTLRPQLSGEEILTRADNACFLAKVLGRNRSHVHRAGDGEVARHRQEIQWISRINAALDSDRFVLYGQRIVPARKREGQRDKYEVLLRMIDEDGAVILPGMFLKAAEHFGLIGVIDRRVVEMVLALMQTMMAEHLRTGASGNDCLPDLSINLSAFSIRDPHLLGDIERSVRAAGIPFERLTFELTETAAIVDLDQAQQFFSRLRALGARVALDDVGAGFNSFANLRSLPLDQVKLDGSFVRRACTDRIDRIFIESMQRIAEAMNLDTVAEFVETERIRDEMTRLRVHYLQGHAIHKPEPLEALLRERSQHAPGGGGERARVQSAPSSVAWDAVPPGR